MLNTFTKFTMAHIAKGALTLVAIFFLQSCIGLNSMPRFSESDLKSIANNVIEKHQIGLAKNIGYLALPALSLEPLGGSGGWPGPGYFLSNTSVESCSETCEQLIDTGYISFFIGDETFQVDKPASAKRAELQDYRQRRQSMMEQLDFEVYGTTDFYVRATGASQEKSQRNYTREFLKSRFVSRLRYCFNETLAENTFAKICTQNGNFVHMVVYGTAGSITDGRKSFGNPLVVTPYSIEGTLTWWQLL